MKVYQIQSSIIGNFQKIGKKAKKQEFSDDVIAEAKRIIEAKEQVNSSDYKKSFFDCWKDAKIQPLEWLVSPIALLATKALNESIEKPLETARLAIGMSTLGISELLKTPEAGIRKLISDVNAKKFARQVEECISAMLSKRV